MSTSISPITPSGKPPFEIIVQEINQPPSPYALQLKTSIMPPKTIQMMQDTITYLTKNGMKFGALIGGTVCSMVLTTLTIGGLITLGGLSHGTLIPIAVLLGFLAVPAAFVAGGAIGFTAGYYLGGAVGGTIGVALAVVLGLIGAPVELLYNYLSSPYTLSEKEYLAIERFINGTKITSSPSSTSSFANKYKKIKELETSVEHPLNWRLYDPLLIVGQPDRQVIFDTQTNRLFLQRNNTWSIEGFPKKRRKLESQNSSNSSVQLLNKTLDSIEGTKLLENAKDHLTHSSEPLEFTLIFSTEDNNLLVKIKESKNSSSINLGS